MGTLVVKQRNKNSVTCTEVEGGAFSSSTRSDPPTFKHPAVLAKDCKIYYVTSNLSSSDNKLEPPRSSLRICRSGTKLTNLDREDRMSGFSVVSCHSDSKGSRFGFLFLISILTEIGRLSLNNRKGTTFPTSTPIFQTQGGPIEGSILDGFKKSYLGYRHLDIGSQAVCLRVRHSEA